jgi:hypothetical protein
VNLAKKKVVTVFESHILYIVMPLKLVYNVTDKQFNWKLTIFGCLFLIFRIICMSVFILPDGNFHPEVFHTSYLISILICMSMIFSFRFKPLNTVAFAVVPSVIFSIFLHDIPLWIDPSSGVFGGDHVVGDLLWWNFLTVHTPIPILAFYMYYTKKETISLHSYFLGLPLLMSWFFILDDKQNGAINGPTYIAIGLPIFILWTLLYVKITYKDWKNGADPLIAKVLEIKSIQFIKKEKISPKIN